MGRKIKAKVNIKEVFFDEELYPRSKYSWQTAYDYAQSMRVGAKFPPIILALLNGKKYLVDGKHRIEACKLLKKDSIPSIVHTGWNKEKIFKEAVRANITHGRLLSPYEKRTIALKLMEFNLKQDEISELIQVPLDKLEKFIGNRLVNSITGEEMNVEKTEEMAKEIGQAILKSGIKHFAGTTLNPEELIELESNQETIYAGSQISLLRNLINMLENNLLDTKNKEVMKLIVKLKKLLIKRG